MASLPAWAFLVYTGPSPAKTVTAATHSHHDKTSSPASWQGHLGPAPHALGSSSRQESGRYGKMWCRAVLAKEQALPLSPSRGQPLAASTRAASLGGTGARPSSARASLNGHLCEPFTDHQPFPPRQHHGRPGCRANCCVRKETLRSPTAIPQARACTVHVSKLFFVNNPAGLCRS